MDRSIVFANSITDRHPDHGRGAKLVSEACYLSGLEKIKTEHDGIQQGKFRPRLLLHYIQDFYRTPDVIFDVGLTDEELNTKFPNLTLNVADGRFKEYEYNSNEIEFWLKDDIVYMVCVYQKIDMDQNEIVP